MTEYRQPNASEVPHYETKYDNCKIVATGQPYRQQKGSGRSAILALAADGMSVGHLTKLAAKQGFDPKFTVGSLLKHHDTKDSAFKLAAPEGQTLASIKKTREPAKLTPERQAAKDAKDAEKTKKAEERAKAIEAKKAKAEDDKAKKLSDAEAKTADKAKKQEEYEARRAEQKAEKEATRQKAAAEKAAKAAEKAKAAPPAAKVADAPKKVVPLKKAAGKK